MNQGGTTGQATPKLGLEEAVGGAVGWVRDAIVGAPGLGAGRGPLNHFAEVR